MGGKKEDMTSAGTCVADRAYLMAQFSCPQLSTAQIIEKKKINKDIGYCHKLRLSYQDYIGKM